MKKLLKLLVKEFGFIFEDFPLESGIGLLLISGLAIYFIRHNIYYIKDRVSIFYYFFNLRTFLYVIAIIGISQILRGLNIYDSLLGDFLEGMKVFEKEYPIILGGILIGICIFFIYDKFRIADDEFEELKGGLNTYKFWAFISLIVFIGASMILRNI